MGDQVNSVASVSILDLRQAPDTVRNQPRGIYLRGLFKYGFKYGSLSSLWSLLAHLNRYCPSCRISRTRYPDDFPVISDTLTPLFLPSWQACGDSNYEKSSNAGVTLLCIIAVSHRPMKQESMHFLASHAFTVPSSTRVLARIYVFIYDRQWQEINATIRRINLYVGTWCYYKSHISQLIAWETS